MNWKGRDGDLYTDRNSPDVDKRAKWFDKVLPKDITGVSELGTNKAQNLQAIAKVRDVLVWGREINNKAAKIARAKGIFVTEDSSLNGSLNLCSGVLIHINPIDIVKIFEELQSPNTQYILMIENKTDSIETINDRWYKNAMWSMSYGEEFVKRYPEWKIIKKGYVNGKKPKDMDFTAPLTETKTGFHPDDFMWLLKRK